MSLNKRQKSPTKSYHEAAVKKQKFMVDDVHEKHEVSLFAKDSLDKFFENDGDFDFMDMMAPACALDNSSKLDLTEWQRCVVEELKRVRQSFELVVKVRAVDQKSDKTAQSCDSAVAKCHLQGPWSHTRIEIGDIVSLLAVWDAQLDAFKVDKDNGYCVTSPDTLISGTTVVGSLFCRRKAVLQDRFRGVDANSKIMVIGSLVHELLQTVLAKNLTTSTEIKSVATELLQSQEVVHTLYSSLISLEETMTEVENFIPNIQSFIQQYVKGKKPVPENNYQGRIDQVQDIEENVWVPPLGLKGKIDISVRIHERGKAPRDGIPLELKTGRASFSMEHKGQLMLYQMMLTAMGKPTNSGMLLYLREGIMREVHSSRNEQRDLIALRNDLSYYLSRMQALPSAELSINSEGKCMQPFELPEPIAHHSACGNCAYATICCAFAKTDPDLHLRNNHPLHKVIQATTDHIQPNDYEYFMKWCHLLMLEDQEAKKSNYLRSLWTDTPEKRQQDGRAVIGLLLCKDVMLEESRYIHTFSLQKKAEEEVDLTLCGFSVGEYVIVSSRKRLSIAAGNICDLTKTTISVNVERDLRKNYTGHCFIVDKHESQITNVFNFTNLGLLLEDTERSAQLRSIIIHKQSPTFTKVLPRVIATAGADILKQLNAVQRAAVLKVLTTENYMLIKGLPGTGKTQTLVAIVRLLQLMGKSVLITSHTHSAVDNLLLRLKPHALPMLRLGNSTRVHPQLRDCSETELTKNCRSEVELAKVYSDYNIVGVTCLGAAHSIFLHRKFDFCIVDEATQVMQPTVLRPLFFCEKFILVGDPDQLPPLIRSREARQRGADMSLFHHIDSEEATAVLTLQYRMNKTITKLANELSYGGALKCATSDVQLGSMRNKSVNVEPKSSKWLERTLQSHIDQSVFVLDTMDCAARSQAFASAKHGGVATLIEKAFAEGGSASHILESGASPTTQKIQSRRFTKYTNYCDAALVFAIVKALLQSGYDPERIGIIAPYRTQVELLRNLTNQQQQFYAKHSPALHFTQIEVNTVDQYQGRDKDIIIYTCVKTGPPSTREFEPKRESEILEDKRRLTVAITRAKHKLIIIGDAECLKQYSPFHTLLLHIPSYCILKLEDGRLDFSWETVLEEFGDTLTH